MITSGSSLAASSKKNAQNETPEDLKCGMGCTYQKAIDTLTQQSLYFQNKYDRLKVIFAQESADADDLTNLEQGLGRFCKGAKTFEEFKDETCWDRYGSFTKMILIKLRDQIGKNEDLIADLHPLRKKNGKLEGELSQFILPQEQRNKDTVLPAISSIQELEAAFLEEQEKLQDPNEKARREKFSSGRVLPVKMQIVEFNDTLVKSSKNSSADLHRVNRTGKGKPVEDSSYTGQVKEAERVARPKDKVSWDELKFTSGDTPMNAKKTPGNLNYQAFEQARNEMINSLIKGAEGNAASTSFTVGSVPTGRNPASWADKSVLDILKERGITPSHQYRLRYELETQKKDIDDIKLEP